MNNDVGVAVDLRANTGLCIHKGANMTCLMIAGSHYTNMLGTPFSVMGSGPQYCFLPPF